MRHRVADGEEWIMGLFRRTPQPERGGRKPTRRERQAAERTARAEATLVETEQKIHQVADEVRSDLKRSA
jgi:hypothetical protein